jgi:hypothetical protein
MNIWSNNAHLHLNRTLRSGLGIYNLNLIIGFLSPQMDPDSDSPALPTRNEEYKPFVRRLPEFKFWPGPADIARHVIGCHLTHEVRVENTFR